MEDPIALSWAKSVHRAHNGTRRVSIISNDKETTWGEGEKERGLSKTSRGVRRSLLLSILSGKRREGGTSVEVDKFFYSRKAEKVTVPSLEGKKRRRKRKRWGTSNETGPRWKFDSFPVSNVWNILFIFARLSFNRFPWRRIYVRLETWWFSCRLEKREKKRVDIMAIDESRGWNKSLWNGVSICPRQIHPWSLMNGGEVDT